jgi:hypothetical protein
VVEQHQIFDLNSTNANGTSFSNGGEILKLVKRHAAPQGTQKGRAGDGAFYRRREGPLRVASIQSVDLID